MPELPETETMARALDAAVRGAVIEGAIVHRGDVLREVGPDELTRRVSGARIERAWRRAKLVVLDLATGHRLVVQPRFTGALLVEPAPPGADFIERERKFLRLTFPLADGRQLHYRDIRCLGTVAVMAPDRFAAYADALGIEPLDPAFTGPHLSGLLRGSRQAVKKLVQDQRRVVGIGNIYANESLWRARIHPARSGDSLRPVEVRRLRDAIVAVLDESIGLGGTTFENFVAPGGERGGFVDRLAAYGRGGRPCPRCETALVDTHAVDGRTTVYCPNCQR